MKFLITCMLNRVEHDMLSQLSNPLAYKYNNFEQKYLLYLKPEISDLIKDYYLEIVVLENWKTLRQRACCTSVNKIPHNKNKDIHFMVPEIKNTCAIAVLFSPFFFFMSSKS